MNNQQPQKWVLHCSEMARKLLLPKCGSLVRDEELRQVGDPAFSACRSDRARVFPPSDSGGLNGVSWLVKLSKSSLAGLPLEEQSHLRRSCGREFI